jgi:hypothetical protein
MLNPKTISDDERKVLEEVAKAKGKTLEQVLIDLGHTLPGQPDKKVEFAGKKEESAPAPEPVVVLQPPAVEKPQASNSNINFENSIIPDFEPPKADSTPMPPPAANEEPAPAEDTESEPENRRPATMRQVCIQCGWDQDVPTIPEPEHKDKIAFLHAVLGQKIFSKRYLLFGDNLRVTLRTLTIKEIDALYAETFKAQKAGLIVTAADYYEHLNRLRLYLQLIGLSSRQTATHIKLPEGLSPETHPEADLHWEEFLKKENCFKEDGTGLVQQIQDYILSKVLKTEHLHRTIGHTCNKFNRLVSKLEASVDNENFWNETEPQS